VTRLGQTYDLDITNWYIYWSINIIVVVVGSMKFRLMILVIKEILMSAKDTANCFFCSFFPTPLYPSHFLALQVKPLSSS